MDLSYVPSALIVACFALFGLGLIQLGRIQKDAIGHLRRISAEEADLIYHRDYVDSDGVVLNWREIRDYCRATRSWPRLRLWLLVVVGAIGGGIGSIFLDQALRN